MNDYKKMQLEHYNLLRTVFDQIDKTQISKSVDRFELNLETNSETDTEIFIRKRAEIYSFRVTTDGGFYDRWHQWNRYVNESELLEAINKIIAI